MAKQLTADDARQSLTAHVESKGTEIFVKYGPRLDWAALQRLLADRVYVRYPCEIVFDHSQLLPGEFAQPVQKGEAPEDGFTMFMHPIFMTQLDVVPALVLCQLTALNYGVFASSDDAETFGAAAFVVPPLGGGRPRSRLKAELRNRLWCPFPLSTPLGERPILRRSPCPKLQEHRRALSSPRPAVRSFSATPPKTRSR